MSQYKPYPAYKNSGVEWLGRVPEHWIIGPYKAMIQIENGSDYKEVEADDGYPVIGSGGPFAYATRMIYDGESVLLGRKGTIDKPLYINCAFWAVDTMYWSIIKPGAHGRFSYYVATTIPFDMYSTNTALPSMTKSVLGSHVVAFPGFEEQQVIASHLDRETARIDALIEKKTRFIELLREKRQALITHAVTKGLDPNVKMKDSGVEWLGEVPEHWETMSLARVTIARCDGPFGSSIKSENYTDSGVRVIRLQNIGIGEFKGRDQAFISPEYCSEVIGNSHDVDPGDLLIAGLGDENNPLGRTCVAPDSLGEAIVKADCYRFRIDKSKALPAFLALQLSATARVECGFISTGSTRERLNLGLAASRVIALPDSIEEQSAIVEQTTMLTTRLDALFSKTEQSIILLKERRSALITSAVTGQIDLREAV